MVLGKLDIHLQEMYLNSYLIQKITSTKYRYLIQKNYIKMHVTANTIKVLEENTGVPV